MVFGFGKKKRPQTTFKERVTEFWEWYSKVAERFYQTIEQGKCQTLVSEVAPVVDRTLPKLSWVFGPGENGGHSFTISGEGQVAKQLLAEYWLSRAPQIPHWTFYSSRQPSTPERLEDFAIRVGEEETIDFDKFLVKTTVDEESQLIHLVVWHPGFANLPEEHHLQLVFLMLDEALGEFGTQTWLGELKIEPLVAGEGTRSLASLPEFIQQVNKYHNWQKLPPLESYTLYEVPDQYNTPRGDSVVGSSCIPNIVIDLLENKGRLSEDPLEGTGAEFVYISVDASVFPEGRQSEVRGNIEDALQDALQADGSGRTLGGAFGHNHSYIDLILFDGENSRLIVEKTLEALQLQGRSQLHSFA